MKFIISEDYTEKSEIAREIDNKGNELSQEQSNFFRNSKIRDGKGNLIVCHHYTDHIFDSFDISKFNDGYLGSGFYFTSLDYFGGTFGSNDMVVYLNIKNPLRLYDRDEREELLYWLEEKYGYKNKFPMADTSDIHHGELKDYAEQITEYAKENGFDGITLDRLESGGSREIVAFYPNQIKSIKNVSPTRSESIYEGMGKLKFTLVENIDDEHLIEAGYKGYSMSNNAVSAYEHGEKPISKWTKSELLGLIKDSYSDLYDVAKDAPLDVLRKIFLIKTSWHHTSSRYNKTDFYSFNNYVDITEDGIISRINTNKPRAKEDKSDKYLADIEYLEWGGTRKRPIPKKIELKDVYVQDNGQWRIIFDENGNQLMRKNISTKGFFVHKK